MTAPVTTMNTPYTACCGQLAKTPKKWLITGVAGFIDSNLLETLLKVDREVLGLDNLGSGHQHNLDEVQPVHRDFPVGDVCHCQTYIGKAQHLLGFSPTHRLAEGDAVVVRGTGNINRTGRLSVSSGCCLL